MIPPTPTPIPVNLASPAYDLDLSPVGGLWERAPNVIGLWNQFPDATPVLQWVIFGLIIFILISAVMMLIKKSGEDV